MGDITATAVREETEEGKKVARSGGSKYLCVFRRRRDEEVIKATEEEEGKWPLWQRAELGGEEGEEGED